MALMSMITGAFTLLSAAKKNLAKEAGVDGETFDKVSGAIEKFMGKDERMQKFLAEQVESARQHDMATFDKSDKFSNRLRSSVRPIITFTAFAWYVYARYTGIDLTQEDYAIIGAIMFFWFGARTFEKRSK